MNKLTEEYMNGKMKAVYFSEYMPRVIRLHYDSDYVPCMVSLPNPGQLVTMRS